MFVLLFIDHIRSCYNYFNYDLVSLVGFQKRPHWPQCSHSCFGLGQINSFLPFCLFISNLFSVFLVVFSFADLPTSSKHKRKLFFDDDLAMQLPIFKLILDSVLQQFFIIPAVSLYLYLETCLRCLVFYKKCYFSHCLIVWFLKASLEHVSRAEVRPIASRVLTVSIILDS